MKFLVSIALGLIDTLSGGKLRLGFAVLSLIGLVATQFLSPNTSLYGWIASITAGLVAYVPNAKPAVERMQSRMALRDSPPPIILPALEDSTQAVEGHSQEAADSYRDSLFKT